MILWKGLRVLLGVPVRLEARLVALVLLRVLLGMISSACKEGLYFAFVRACVQLLLLDILAIDTNMRLCFPADKLGVWCFVEVQRERSKEQLQSK